MRAPDEIALFAKRLNAVGADYMITGATAAIIYGQPRLTNDLDVVVALRDEHLPASRVDIRAILATTSVDRAVVAAWATRLGLADLWVSVRDEA